VAIFFSRKIRAKTAKEFSCKVPGFLCVSRRQAKKVKDSSFIRENGMNLKGSNNTIKNYIPVYYGIVKLLKVECIES
jgi:hypothetical protein